MSPVKQEAINLIRKLPDDCTLEDIRYQLYVREQVEEGIKALDEGRTVSLEEAERRMAGWLKSSGPNQRSRASKKA
jgi:predicted transcriptional regulator